MYHRKKTSKVHKSKRHVNRVRRTKSRKSVRGGNVLAKAALPFGLIGLQKMLHENKTRRNIRRFGKSAKKFARNTRRLV